MADDTLLQMKGLVIEATSYPPGEPPKDVTLVHGVDLTLKRGRVLGLIGESGAGKSTIGLSAMSYGRGGVRLTGGTIHLNGREIRLADAKTLRALRGREVTYVSQSAIASFNPAKQIMEQVIETSLSHGLSTKAEAEARARIVPQAWPAEPRHVWRPLSASGVWRAIATRDDGHGALSAA